MPILTTAYRAKQVKVCLGLSEALPMLTLIWVLRRVSLLWRRWTLVDGSLISH